jgi:hypothetical protein
MDVRSFWSQVLCHQIFPGTQEAVGTSFGASLSLNCRFVLCWLCQCPAKLLMPMSKFSQQLCWINVFVADEISSSLSKSADQLPEKWMMKFKGTDANSSAIEKYV